MIRDFLRIESRRAAAISLALLMILGLVGTMRLATPVRAGGQNEQCVSFMSGNGDESDCATNHLDPQVESSTDGGTTWQQAFIVQPNADAPEFTYDVIPGTHYVSISCNRAAAEQTTFLFRTTFVFPALFANPSFTIDVNSDNSTKVFLNGNLVGAQLDAEDPLNFKDPADTFTTNTAAFFQGGVNTILFEVKNFTNQLALDFKGQACFSPFEPPPTCRTCDESVVVVDQDVTVDLNPAVPTCSGDPDLCAFLTFTKVGPISNWKAIFNLGAKKLLVKNGATVTVKPGPPNGGNNKQSPGIEIRTTCDVEVEAGGVIAVQSINQQAGDILIQADGNVLINGTVSDSVIGTNGRPGKVTIASCCGGITTGPSSLIETVGVDHGGNDINLITCGGSSGGDIVINGLVDASYKAAIAPTINIAALAGAVTIDGNNFQGIEAGTKRRITSGVTVRSNRDPLAGTIKIQANNDITVRGNAILAKLYPNYGAVAVKPTSTNGTSGDGAIIAVSVNGRIIATDRAFDIANRFNLKNDITLFAAGDIDLSVTASKDDGAATNAKPVVNSQGGSAGKGGVNTLRSYSGGINIGANAQVLANFVGTPGSDGTNSLTSCGPVVNNGTILPATAPAVACVPSSPGPLFESCAGFNVCGNRVGNGN